MADFIHDVCGELAKLKGQLQVMTEEKGAKPLQICIQGQMSGQWDYLATLANYHARVEGGGDSPIEALGRIIFDHPAVFEKILKVYEEE